VKEHIIVIGSGFSSLAAATVLADKGLDVTIVEKNNEAGGRARQFSSSGFTFDMGPSWYWMPDVFENYFERFGKRTSDYYQLKRLDPSYRVFFEKNTRMDIPANYEALRLLFENHEAGSAQKLDLFLKEAQYKYRVGMNKLVFKPGQSIREFAQWDVLKGLFKLQLFNSLSSHVRKYFKNPFLIQLLEFPVLFLGAKPSETPALYSLMNYADISLGTWYPMGGMHQIVEAMTSLAKEKGVSFRFNCEVEKLHVEGSKVSKVLTSQGEITATHIISGADYHHTDQRLLDSNYRNYSKQYWSSRKMAPSSLLFYLGLNKRLQKLQHHNLFFDEDFDQHAKEIYDTPQWPEKPLFYACVPSKTDSSVAPQGSENLFILIPVAPGLKDNISTRELYFNRVMDRLENLTGEKIRPHVVFKRSYAHTDFISDYHAFKGNAYGLANTLRQTAILKPSIRNKKLKNLFYTGQLTTPGPGVPPSLISGQVVASELLKSIN
jgi:phytoene desaturase